MQFSQPGRPLPIRGVHAPISLSQSFDNSLLAAVGGRSSGREGEGGGGAGLQSASSRGDGSEASGDLQVQEKNGADVVVDREVVYGLGSGLYVATARPDLIESAAEAMAAAEELASSGGAAEGDRAKWATATDSARAVLSVESLEESAVAAC